MRALLRSLALAVAIAATAGPTVSLAADPAPISQAEWVGQKKSVTLPNGLTLKYVELGDPSAPPVVLLHGYTDNSRSFSLVAPHIQNRRLLALDQRGHGSSDKPECCYTLTDMADDVRLLLDALEIERADVVGHSLGSMVALTLAANHPERVGKLVLIGSTSAPGLKRGDWLWESVYGLTEPIDPNGEFMTAWYANPTPVNEDYLSRERAESAAVPLHVWKGVLRELVTNEYGRLLPDVKAPTLILWGDKDSFFDASHQKALREALPGATFRDFPGYGHNLFWEVPEEAGAAISKHLDG